MGLTALARFAEHTVDGDLNILLSVESSQVQEDWGTNQELMATNVNRLVLQQLYLKNIPTTLTFQGTGAGCALLQVYSVIDTDICLKIVVPRIVYSGHTHVRFNYGKELRGWILDAGIFRNKHEISF